MMIQWLDNFQNRHVKEGLIILVRQILIKNFKHNFYFFLINLDFLNLKYHLINNLNY